VQVIEKEGGKEARENRIKWKEIGQKKGLKVEEKR